MNHVLLGAFVPFVVALIIYAARGGRASLKMLVVTPILMGMGALWAVAPDLPRLFRRPELYGRLAQEPKCDMFLWHYSIDQVEGDAGWCVVVFLGLVCALVLAAWRELRILERG